MSQWMAQNAGTIAVSAALIALIGWIVVTLRRDKRQGKSACGGSCGHCPNAGLCHRAK